jgi:uncharacterized iron-regulated membrane protein
LLLFAFVVAFFFRLPVELATHYSDYYGYQLLPDEAPGPMGDTGGFIAVLLWLLALVALIGYVIYVLDLWLRPRH